jgi:hypothetical protein
MTALAKCSYGRIIFPFSLKISLPWPSSATLEAIILGENKNIFFQ